MSTRLGVEGLTLVDGEEIVLADDPRVFAREVAGLLADPPRRRRPGLAARRRLEAENSLLVLGAAVRRALEAAGL